MASIYASYGDWKYRKATVRQRANQIIEALAELRWSGFSFDCVVLTGSSGVWLGGLLQGHDQWHESVPLVLCRKEGENSHGSSVEGECCGVHRAVLVDDFVATGATVERTRDSLARVGVDLVAVLEHCHLELGLPVRSRNTHRSIPLFRRE